MRLPYSRTARTVAGLLSLFGVATTAHAGWDKTQSRVLVPISSIAQTPVADALPMHVMVSLKLRNKDELQTFLKNQHTPGNPQYGIRLSSAQFAAQYSPTAQQAQAVADYLKASGFRNVSMAGNRVLISADGTAAQVQKAFNTTIMQYLIDGKTVHSPVTGVMVPDTLGGSVLSVSGLQNVLVKHTHLSTLPDVLSPAVVPTTLAQALAAKGVPAAGDAASAHIAYGFTPADLRTAYNADAMVDGSNTFLGIATEGDDLSQVIADLHQAEKVYGLPYVPTEVVQTAPLPDPQDTSGDGEWDLDSQSASGIARNLKGIIFYNSSDLGDSLLATYNQFVTENRAVALNMSYGGCDLGGNDADDQAFMQGNAQGQTFFVSSGDAGAACSVAVNLVMPDTGLVGLVEAPEDSPYVVSVGGTSLFPDDKSNIGLEIAWAASGGGYSLFEAAPDWQAAAGVIGANATRRGVPDISMVAGFDINAQEAAPVFASAYYTYSGGVLYRSIGTSLSSPLAAGAWARMQSAHCNQLGFAAPLFYALDTAGGPGSTAAGFNDIVLGSNGLYVATPGWDNTTGFGSMDISAINAALPAADCAANAEPSASMSVDSASGAAPLSVSVDASGSKDADGDGIDWYVMDYDDGTPVVFQHSAKFAPHSYANAGVYYASLQVRDGRGAPSVSKVQAVTVTGTPAACVAPGQVLITSPSGAAGVQGVDVGQGTDDLLSVSIAEPGDMDGKLVFTMKVDNLKAVLPGFRWLTYFSIPNDNNLYFVSMSSSDGPAPVFNYGTRGFVPGGGYRALQVLGDLDATSNYNADGTITLVLDKAALKLATGDHLSNLVAYVALAGPDDPSGAVGGVTANAMDVSGTALNYTLLGNDTCAADTKQAGISRVSAPLKGRFGGALGLGLLLPLLLGTALRRRQRA